MKTNEAVYVVKGEITCNLYTKKGSQLTQLKLEQKLIVLFNEAHEYIIDEMYYNRN